MPIRCQGKITGVQLIYMSKAQRIVWCQICKFLAYEYWLLLEECGKQERERKTERYRERHTHRETDRETHIERRRQKELVMR